MTLLQITDDEYTVAFAQNEPRDRLSKAEFSAFLTRHRRNTAIGNKQRNKSKGVPEPRLINASEADFLATNRQLTEAIFHQSEYIELEALIRLRDDFRVALLHYEVRSSDAPSSTASRRMSSAPSRRSRSRRACSRRSSTTSRSTTSPSSSQRGCRGACRSGSSWRSTV